MKSVEKTGRTVDEAIDSALAELGVAREDCIIEVLLEPSRGFRIARRKGRQGQGHGQEPG